MQIPKKQLNIDGDYQRGEVSKEKVGAIAKHWDWRWFGTISVAMRGDGSLWVFDGGHRVRASFLRSDIKELPCMVFTSEGRRDESRSFIGKNTIKSNVSSYHLQKAGVVSGDEKRVLTQEIIERYGYQTSKSEAPYGFQAIATLFRIVNIDARLAEKVFEACSHIAQDGEQITAHLLRGLFLLASRKSTGAVVLAPENVEKLKAMGVSGIMAIMGRKKAEVGMGGERIEAMALIDIINKGRRGGNRLSLE